MAIVVQCNCGKRFSVKDELAGKRGKCRDCGHIIIVPMRVIREVPACNAHAGAATLVLGEYPQCPSCMRKLAHGVKICMNCGIHIDTGKPIILRQEVDEETLRENVNSVASYLSWFVPIGLFPIASDAYGKHRPIAVQTIAALTAVVSITFWILDAMDQSPLGVSSPFMLWCGSLPNPLMARLGVQPGEFHFYQLITNAFLHGGIMHLAGNLVFLLVFGNRINALLGQWQTAGLYIGLAVIASFVFWVSQVGEPIRPALGASGAIMGMAGLYFVLMPATRVYMIFWIRVFGRYTKFFSLRGFWVLLFYIAFDVIATARGSHDGTAHWAHLGGFIGGMAVGAGLLIPRAVNPGGADLLTLLLGKHAWKILGTPAERAQA